MTSALYNAIFLFGKILPDKLRYAFWKIAPLKQEEESGVLCRVKMERRGGWDGDWC
jgi:hypothetical protein